MSCKRWSLLILLILGLGAVQAQKPAAKAPDIDTSMTDYALLFDELEAFLDSLTKPRSFTLINIGASNRYYNIMDKSEFTLESEKQMMISPSLGYFHKSGIGLSVTGTVMRDEVGFNPYQAALTGSYDYTRKRSLLTGLSFTRYLTKDSLHFYTSPLQNEVFTYFTYRGWWARPTIAASYGWGSRSEYMEREEFITSLRLIRTGYTTVDIQESIADFNLMASVRHDFYWLDVLSGKDFIRLTPQVSFTSGTQKFGFNQTSTYSVTKGNGKGNGNNRGLTSNSENVTLDDHLAFQPLSLSAYIKSEYSIGKFFVQPTVMVDYYFPAPEKNLSTVFSLNAGVIF